MAKRNNVGRAHGAQYPVTLRQSSRLDTHTAKPAHAHTFQTIRPAPLQARVWICICKCGLPITATWVKTAQQGDGRMSSIRTKDSGIGALPFLGLLPSPLGEDSGCADKCQGPGCRAHTPPSARPRGHHVLPGAAASQSPAAPPLWAWAWGAGSPPGIPAAPPRCPAGLTAHPPACGRPSPPSAQTLRTPKPPGTLPRNPGNANPGRPRGGLETQALARPRPLGPGLQPPGSRIPS